MAYTREQYNEFVESELTQQDRKSYWGTAVGVGLPATAFAVGFMRTKSGGRVWDIYFKALQHMEGALPMGLGATFRLSEIISPLAAPEKFSLTPLEHPDLFKGRAVQDYFSRITGRRAAELRELGVFSKGVEWQRTGTTLGELRVAGGGPVLASNIAALSTGPRRTGHILEWFNRVTGVRSPTFFSRIQETEDYLRPAFMPIGAKESKAKLAGKFLYSVASSGIGRMNLLLSSPYDLPIMEELAKKVPILGKARLGVRPGTGAQMLARYAGKAAIVLGAYHGLKYVDYLGREYGPAVSTPAGAAVGAVAGAALGFGRGTSKKYALIGAAAGGILGGLLKGPFTGAAEIYARARVTQAEVSDTLGLRSGAQRTEEFFPGLTKPTTLIAAAGVGLLLGGTADYYERLSVARAIGKGRKTIGDTGKRAKDVYEEAEGWIKAKREALYKSYGDIAKKEVGLKRIFAQVKQRFQGSMKGGKFSPGSRAGAGAAIGTAVFAGLSFAGTALAGDFGGTLLTAAATAGAGYAYLKKGPLAALGVLALPLLLREKEDPERLKRIYRGDELVPVKSGRAWESGRTPYEGGRPYFRPHRVAMMRTGGVQEAALYGSESAYWETDFMTSPLSWLADPYAREKLMWEQGYKFPVSKTPFEDFPIIGPLLATTIGRAIKPPKYMGRDEWLPDPATTKVPEGWEELPMESPIKRTSLRGTVGEQMYRMTELCLPGEALISMQDGTEKPIEKISEGDRVMTGHGPCQVTKVSSHSLRKEENFREITAQGMAFPLRITGDHKVFALRVVECNRKGPGCLCTPNGSRTGQHCSKCTWRPYLKYSPSWIPAQKLEKGDYFVRQILPADERVTHINLIDFLPENYSVEDSKIISLTEHQVPRREGSLYKNYKGTLIERGPSKSHNRIDKRTTTLPLRIELDFDFGWLCGYTLAEGYIGKYRVTWGAHTNEIDTNVARLSLLTERFFKRTPTVFRKKDSCCNQTNGIEAVISSIDVEKALFSLLSQKEEKRLHPVLETANKDFLMGVLHGLIDGDGHVRQRKSSEVFVGLANKNLIRQLRDIFARCGIYAGMSVQETNVREKSYTSYHLTVSSAGTRKLAESQNVGEKLRKVKVDRITSNTRRSFVLETEDGVQIYHRVLQNLSTGEEGFPVYDIGVEEEHSFFADDFFVHNCGLPGFAAQSIKERITGNESWFPNDQWATPSLVSGTEPGWWSLELGGLGLTCIPEGSIVQTSSGNKTIEEILPGDKVLSRDGKFHSVKMTSRRREKEIATISVETFGSKLRATLNHSVPVWESYPCHNRNSRSCIINKRGLSCRTCSRREKKIESIDKLVEDIRLGDWLEVPLPIENFRNCDIDLAETGNDNVYTDNYIYVGTTQYFADALELLESGQAIDRESLRAAGIPDQSAKEALTSLRRGRSPRRLKRFLRLTNELAYLAGWYAAEGTLFHNGITLTLNISEKKFAKKLQKIAERAVQATSNIYDYSEKHVLRLMINSPALKRMVEILVGAGSHTKKIDSRIMYGSRSIRAAFLRGYMLGDGFCNTDKNAAGISTCSRDLANQAFLIGLSLGFRGRNFLDYLEKPNGHYPQGGKRKDTLRHYIDWAKSTVPFIPEFLNGKYDVLPAHGINRGSFIYEEKLYVKVSNILIEEEKECWVYDLAIEDLHYFTSDYFAVHNSEALRRYIPHRRSDVNYRNPLPSGLPSWLPGPDSYYYQDFSRADIYSQIKEPWARLPGKGFAALHPELKGVDPEAYSPYWRFRVLCLDKTTRVLTSLGMKKIENVSPGDYVYGSDGFLKEVIEVKSRKGNEDRYVITSFYNEYPLICSGNHKVLVAKKDGVVQELPARDITQEHYLLLPKRRSFSGRDVFCIGDYCSVEDVTLRYREGEYWAHVKGSQKELRFNLPVTYALGRLFGLYIAEGCANQQSHQVVWTFHLKEKDTFGQEVRDFASLLGLSWHHRILPEKNTYHISINNKLLARLFCNIFGSGAINKKIGFDVTEFSEDFLLGLIDGYFDGDGNLCVQTHSITLRASSISRDLLEQIRIYLAFLGIISSLRERKGAYKEISHLAWTLDIRRKDIHKLPAYTKTLFKDHKYKPTELRTFSFQENDFVAFRVKDISVEKGESLWFDLAIDDPGGTHCFVTSHGLVHNSDLAPWSQEYGQYDKIMSEMVAQKRLTAEQILQIQTTRKQVREAKKAREFQRLKYDESTERKTVKITGELAPGLYLTDTFGSAPIALEGVDSSGVSLANIAMRQDASLTASEALRVGQAKRAQLSDYLREHLYPGAEIDVFVHKDPSSLMERGPGGMPTVPVVAVAGGTNINRQLLQMGLGEREESSLGALDPMAATGEIQRVFGSFWENLTHGAETPLESLTPVAPIAKFVHQRTPLEEYQRSEVFGRDVALWQKPISHFIAPGLQTTMWWAGWKDLPADVKERHMVEEYFDRLKYMKWERLSNAARAQGNAAAASQYMARAEKTMTGADIFSERSAYLALAKQERAYFEHFVYSPSAKERREISQYVSPQLNRVLHAQWARRAAEQAQMRTEAGISGPDDQRIMASFNGLRSPDAQAQRQAEIRAALEETPVPGPSWVGWQPEASVDNFKVKTVHDKEMDLSRYGLWESDLERIERKPWVEPIGAAMIDPARPIGNPGNIRRRFNRSSSRFGHRGPNVFLTADDWERMNIEDSGHDRLHRYMRDPSIMHF